MFAIEFDQCKMYQHELMLGGLPNLMNRIHFLEKTRMYGICNSFMGIFMILGVIYSILILIWPVFFYVCDEIERAPCRPNKSNQRQDRIWL